MIKSHSVLLNQAQRSTRRNWSSVFKIFQGSSQLSCQRERCFTAQGPPVKGSIGSIFDPGSRSLDAGAIGSLTSALWLESEEVKAKPNKAALRHSYSQWYGGVVTMKIFPIWFQFSIWKHIAFTWNKYFWYVFLNFCLFSS